MDLVLRPVAPYRLDFTVLALRRDPVNPVDRWESFVYKRVFVFKDKPLAVTVEQVTPPAEPELAVRLTGPGAEEVQQTATDLLRAVLGLEVDLAPFYRLAARDERLAPLVRRYPGLKPPIMPTVFETLVSAIACQQLSLIAGMHLLAHLSETYGVVLGGRHAFPRPSDVLGAAPEDLRRLGFSMRKSRTILRLAEEAAGGRLDLEGLTQLDTEEVVRRLTALPGVGRWTAQYVALRGMRRLDTFPTDDVGGQNKLQRLLELPERPDHVEVGRILERWRPYPGLVYFYLLLDQLARSGRLAEAAGFAGTGAAAMS